MAMMSHRRESFYKCPGHHWDHIISNHAFVSTVWRQITDTIQRRRCQDSFYVDNFKLSSSLRERSHWWRDSRTNVADGQDSFSTDVLIG
jgi:hypothetical protein